MAPTKVCIAKLKKELRAILLDPPPYIPAVHVGDAITTWHFLLRGPPDTPYEGGWYVGRLRFDDNYPFSAPHVSMITPNGRFATGTAICVDGFTAFHAWNPSWSVATILKGFLSFMCDDDVTTGGLAASDAQRRQLAAASLDWNLKAPGGLGEMFPILQRAADGEDVGDGSGEGGGGAPEAGAPAAPPPPPEEPAAAPEEPPACAAAVDPPPPPKPPLRVSAADLATIATAAAETAAGDPAAGAARLDKAVRKYRKKGEAPPPDLLMAAARALATGLSELSRAAALAGEAAGAEDPPAGAAEAAAVLRTAAADLEAGSAAAGAGDYETALAAYDRVLSGEDTACSAARVGRAAALAGRGDAAGAVATYAAARAADPSLGADVVRAYAAALKASGRAEEAERVLEEGGVGVERKAKGGGARKKK